MTTRYNSMLQDIRNLNRLQDRNARFINLYYYARKIRDAYEREQLSIDEYLDLLDKYDRVRVARGRVEI